MGTLCGGSGPYMNLSSGTHYLFDEISNSDHNANNNIIIYTPAMTIINYNCNYFEIIITENVSVIIALKYKFKLI
jgi:hypothetical protein